MSPRARHWIIGIAATLCTIAAVLGLLGWYVLTHLQFGDDTDSPTTAQIESYGWFKLPPSARNIHARLEGFQDHALWARFDMNASDEPAFWKSTKCATSPDITDAATAKKEMDAEFTSPIRLWWSPRFMPPFSARSTQKPGIWEQQVLVEHGPDGSDTVFVLYFDF